MKPLQICAVITDMNQDLTQVTEIADLFEVRIDLIGNGWEELTQKLPKPWIACNRRKEEGGNPCVNEKDRITELKQAIQMGADIIDIELATPELEALIPLIKKESSCLISSHNMQETPSLAALGKTVEKQLNAGADICKVVTYAAKNEDNLTVLKLISEFPENKIVAFAMGEKGLASRILCPIVGGAFTYASIAKGAESAAGQLTVSDLYEIYRMVQK
ncbi:MAG: type I 3-dehydroquinate dehydratase [Dehalococcoidales bacterium]